MGFLVYLKLFIGADSSVYRILGYFILPGTPDKPNRIFLKQKDIDLAVQRLKRAGHATSGKFEWRVIRQLYFYRFSRAGTHLDVYFSYVLNSPSNTQVFKHTILLKAVHSF